MPTKLENKITPSARGSRSGTKMAKSSSKINQLKTHHRASEKKKKKGTTKIRWTKASWLNCLLIDWLTKTKSFRVLGVVFWWGFSYLQKKRMVRFLKLHHFAVKTNFPLKYLKTTPQKEKLNPCPVSLGPVHTHLHPLGIDNFSGISESRDTWHRMAILVTINFSESYHSSLFFRPYYKTW